MADGFPVAIDPETRQPGVGIKIDLRTGASNAAGGEVRILVIACKASASGTITPDVDIEEDVTPDQVGGFLGTGMLGHLSVQRIFEEWKTAKVDLVAPESGGGSTATGTVTFDDSTPITVDQLAKVTVAGRVVKIVWKVGETDIDAATKLVAKANAMTKNFPAIATNGGGTLAVVTFSAKGDGNWGNDITLEVSLTGGTGGDLAAGDAVFTGGSGEPDLTNVLELVANREYRLIVACLSNTDIADPTGNPALIKAHITGHNVGIGALLQTAHFACTDSLENAKAMASAHDTEYFSHHLWPAGRSLPAEWAGAIVGAYGKEIVTDANHNFIDREFVATLYAPPSIDEQALSAVEIEDALDNGVSYGAYTAQGVPKFARPITTYFEDSDGNPDDRILDVGKVFGNIAVGSDLRVLFQRTFKGKKLMKNLPSGHTPIPPNIVEEKDAQALAVGRIRSQWVTAGVVREDALDAAIADGTLVVRVDTTDETQLDLFLPLRIVPPLVKTSIYIVQA